MTLEFRAARPEDCSQVVELIYSSAPEIYDYLFTTQSHNVKNFLAWQFKKNIAFCAYSLHTVATIDETPVGIAAFYDSKQYQKISLQMIAAITRFYRLTEIPNILKHVLQSTSMMKTPPKDSLYIANLGVHHQIQSRGIGRGLIDYQAKKAKQENYKTMSLDVAVTNPRAQTLYERLGFKVKHEKQFTGDKGHNIPDCRFMIKEFN